MFMHYFQNTNNRSAFRSYYVDELEMEEALPCGEPLPKKQCDDHDIIEYPLYKNQTKQNYSKLFNTEKDALQANNGYTCKSTHLNDLDDTLSVITCPPLSAQNPTHIIKIEIYELDKIEKIPLAEQWKFAERRIKYITDTHDIMLDEAKSLTFQLTKNIKKHPQKKYYKLNKT